MMIDANTPPGAQAETDLGYPRSSGAKLMMAFSVIATLAGGVCLMAGGLVLLLADWEGPWTLVSMNSVALLVGLGMVEVAIRAGQLSGRFYTSRLIATPDGVRLDGRGRRTYTWSQIARFETGTHPKSGDAFGALVLVDGTRIELHALLEEKGVDGHERAGHPVEVAERIRTLNHLLEQARRGP
jgi:hypothetical protein